METFYSRRQSAFHLGRGHGERDRAEGYTNNAPLSGEWAGESPKEILGALLNDDDDDTYIMDAYEEGYQEGNA